VRSLTEQDDDITDTNPQEARDLDHEGRLIHRRGRLCHW